jgi:hypothetical protein
MIYDRITNARGVRCDIYSNHINTLGRDPKTGWARRPLDNVGVQYGLVAFNGRKINAEQFVDLNERIGGYDEDGNIVPSRTEAEPEAVRIAYAQGLVLTGGGGLSRIPILDVRSYSDDQGDNHVHLRTFQTRSRLIRASGSADNQTILVDPPVFSAALLDPENPNTLDLWQRASRRVQLIDRWLDNIAADSAPGTASLKVARNLPTELSEGCWQVDGRRVIERTTYDGLGRCNEIYPAYKDPRLAAGAPVSGDVLKCVLKPISPADYTQRLSPNQLERLQSVFPAGVCDYGRPGLGQQITTTVWQQYKGEPQMISQTHEP